MKKRKSIPLRTRHLKQHDQRRLTDLVHMLLDHRFTVKQKGSSLRGPWYNDIDFVIAQKCLPDAAKSQVQQVLHSMREKYEVKQESHNYGMLITYCGDDMWGRTQFILADKEDKEVTKVDLCFETTIPYFKVKVYSNCTFV